MEYVEISNPSFMDDPNWMNRGLRLIEPVHMLLDGCQVRHTLDGSEVWHWLSEANGRFIQKPDDYNP